MLTRPDPDSSINSARPDMPSFVHRPYIHSTSMHQHASMNTERSSCGNIVSRHQMHGSVASGCQHFRALHGACSRRKKIHMQFCSICLSSTRISEVLLAKDRNLGLFQSSARTWSAVSINLAIPSNSAAKLRKFMSPMFIIWTVAIAKRRLRTFVLKQRSRLLSRPS